MSSTARCHAVVLAVVALVSAMSACSGAASPPPATAASTPAVAGVDPAAQRYVDAVNTRSLDALVAAFVPNGEVVDVSRHIRGSDAIRAWADNEVIGGTLRVEGVTPLDADTQRLHVHWAPSGSSGWAADYTFTTRAGRISVADLQYAS